MRPPSLNQYTVKWKPGGVNPDKNIEHSRYIDNICEHFVEGVMRQVTHKRTRILGIGVLYRIYNNVMFLLAHLVHQPKSFLQSCFSVVVLWHHPVMSLASSVHNSPGTGTWLDAETSQFVCI